MSTPGALPRAAHTAAAGSAAAAAARRPRSPMYLRSAPVCAKDRRALGPGDAVVQAPCGHVLHAACSALVARSEGRPCSCEPPAPGDGARRAQNFTIRRWRVPGMPAPRPQRPFCALDERVLKSGDETLQLPCAHIFHRVCIARYWRSEGSQICPVDGRHVAGNKKGFAVLRTWTVPAEAGEEDEEEENDGDGGGNAVVEADTNVKQNSGKSESGDEELRQVLERFEHMELQTWERERALLSRSSVHGRADERLVALQKKLLEERVRFLKRRDEILQEISKIERDVETKKEIEVTCTIDLGIIERGEEVVTLPCMDVFHMECILPYLKRERAPQCPNCRTHVDIADIDRLPVWKWGERRARGSDCLTRTKN